MPSMENRYRVKLVTKFDDGNTDCHYWHRRTIEDAQVVVACVKEYMQGVPCEWDVWIYLDTHLGHIRVG